MRIKNVLNALTLVPWRISFDSVAGRSLLRALGIGDACRIGRKRLQFHPLERRKGLSAQFRGSQQQSDILVNIGLRVCFDLLSCMKISKYIDARSCFCFRHACCSVQQQL